MSTSESIMRSFGGKDWRRFVRALFRGRTRLRSKSAPDWENESAYELLGFPTKWNNWAGNQYANPRRRFRGKSAAFVEGLIKTAVQDKKKVRVVGAGYSFSPLVPTDDYMLDLTGMNDCKVDARSKTITAGPGTTIAKLHRTLVRERLCLPTAPVIPWVTVGGALATGVHGTGSGFGTLSDLVVRAHVIDAKGDHHDVDGPQSGKLTDEGRALGCNLGALGVVTEVTFQAVDLFNLHAKDDTNTYWLHDTMLRSTGLSSLLQEAPYVSALWWPGTERCWVKKWEPTNEPPTTSDVQYLLNQLGIWLGADPVGRMGEVLADHPEWTPIFTSMVFDEIGHREYISPAPDVFHFLTRYPMVWNMSFAFDVEGYSSAGIARVVDAWQALVSRLELYRRKGLFPKNMAAHMRHIKSSSSLLSPSTGHNGSVTLEIVTLQGQGAQTWPDFFEEIEDAWLALGGRPHWGKVHSWGDAGGEPSNRSKLDQIMLSYPQRNLDAFRALRREWDGQHLFRNPYTEALQL